MTNTHHETTQISPSRSPHFEEILFSPGAMCPVYEKGMRHACVVGLPPPDTVGAAQNSWYFDGGYNSDPEYITCCFMVSSKLVTKIKINSKFYEFTQ